MSADRDEYASRAGIYRLLAAFPGQSVDFAKALDDVMADPGLRDIISALVGVAFGGYIVKLSGDVPAAIDLINRELRAAEDLDSLGHQ